MAECSLNREKIPDLIFDWSKNKTVKQIEEEEKSDENELRISDEDLSIEQTGTKV